MVFLKVDVVTAPEEPKEDDFYVTVLMRLVSRLG